MTMYANKDLVKDQKQMEKMGERLKNEFDQLYKETVVMVTKRDEYKQA